MRCSLLLESPLDAARPGERCLYLRCAMLADVNSMLDTAAAHPDVVRLGQAARLCWRLVNMRQLRRGKSRKGVQEQ